VPSVALWSPLLSYIVLEHNQSCICVVVPTRLHFWMPPSLTTLPTVLAKAPKDEDAFKAKVVALIQQGETASALTLIQGLANPGIPFALEKVSVNLADRLSACLPPCFVLPIAAKLSGFMLYPG
jgi:hypothetical protein